MDENVTTEKKPKKQTGFVTAKMFTKKLKNRKSKRKISESVFSAFVSVAKPIDIEKNYLELWKRTFDKT